MLKIILLFSCSLKMSKQLLNTQKRNIKKRKLEACNSVSQQFVKWLRTQTPENGRSAEEIKYNTTLQADEQHYI